MSNNYYPPYQPMQYQQQYNRQYQVRPVGSREEAVAAQVDYFSLGLLMPVPGQPVIFFKRFNPDTGMSDFVEFIARQPEPPVQYVTRDEFEAWKQSMGGVTDA